MSALTLKTHAWLRPMEGLTACGDATVTLVGDGWQLAAVIDALGHGPDAAASAEVAVQTLMAGMGQPLVSLFDSVHHALARKRGVVMSAMLLEGATASFAGVGNVELFGPAGVSRPVTMAGTLGGGSYRFRSFPLPLAVGQRWALVTDGIKARDGATLFAAHGALPGADLAELLVAQAGRGHDDVGVLVIDVEAA